MLMSQKSYGLKLRFTFGIILETRSRADMCKKNLFLYSTFFLNSFYAIFKDIIQNICVSTYIHYNLIHYKRDIFMNFASIF